MPLRHFLCIVLLLTNVTAIALDRSSAPAKLRNDEHGLANQIVFPKVEGDVVQSIACNVPVSAQGSLFRKGDLIDPPSPEHNQYCIGGEDSYQFERKIIEALQRSKMTPASYDGRHIPVAMKVTAVFSRQGDREDIFVIPNWYLNNPSFGVNYLAPQILLRSIIKNSAPRCLRSDLMLKLFVTADGSVSDVQPHSGDISKRCRQQTHSWVEKWQFIPGHVNGEPTGMEFLVTPGRDMSFGY